MELNKSNYFSPEADLHYMSVSQFKSFLPGYGGCEAAAVAKIHGEFTPTSPEAFVEGHYVHAWNEGTLDEFKDENPDLYSSRGETKGQLKSNYRHCEKMIQVLANDPLVTKALAGEKEVIMTSEMFGVPWKVMLDSYQPKTGLFADLKVLKEIDGKWWNRDAGVYENFLQHYGYTIQMAVYAEIEKRVTGRDDWLLPHMVVVTKQHPPDHEIIYFDYEIIEQSLAIVENNIERVLEVKAGKSEPIRCERCEYCRMTKEIKRIKHYSELNLY